ncbi:MAG: hypothetical protein U0Z44_20310 [Kouleothrix sp.]
MDVLRAGVYEQIWEDAPGVSYGRGCGPPVLPPGASEPFGTLLRQFVGTVGWLGQTTWADPLQFLPQANPDTLALENGTPLPIAAGPGDPTLGDALVQLPPPGHLATTLLQPAPGGAWATTIAPTRCPARSAARPSSIGSASCGACYSAGCRRRGVERVMSMICTCVGVIYPHGMAARLA